MKFGPAPLPIARNEFELQLADKFFAEGLSVRSVKLYLTAIRKAEKWCEAVGCELANVSAYAVAAYADTLPHTWASRRRLRSALMHYWDAVGRVDAPVKAIRVPKKPTMTSKALDEEIAKKLAIAARARSDKKGAVVLLGLYLGLRRAEIASLRWVDFKDESLSWVTIVGKGDVTASLPVHRFVQRALFAIRPEHPGMWVFQGSDGHISPSTVWAWARKVGEEAGLGRVPTHVLRHTCLTTANDRTRDLRAVQVFARHSRPETTAGYTRVFSRQLTQVMESLDYEEVG